MRNLVKTILAMSLVFGLVLMFNACEKMKEERAEEKQVEEKKAEEKKNEEKKAEPAKNEKMNTR